MKIALQAGAPEPDQLTAFMQAYSETDITAAISQTADADQVITAYDSEQLVGIGSRFHAPGQQSVLKVYIAPGYERRGIDGYMAKLLLPKSERLGTAG